MKSKLSLILILVVVAVAAVLVYVFVINKSDNSGVPTNTVANSGLVSTTTGAPQGIQNQNTAVSTGASQTGSQVVQILRNLSVIQLDDSVFKNPAFNYLMDVSVTLPPATGQGRRNPFANTSTTTGTTSPAPTIQ